MNLRQYCEQMGLKLERKRTSGAPDMRDEYICIDKVVVLIDDRAAPAEARGATRKDAECALIRLITDRILRSTVRETTLYWVPLLET